MEDNGIFLKVHDLEESDILQEIQLEDEAQNRLLSQALLSSQDIKLDESPMQWGYVIDTDAKLDSKLPNYESKPATITVIKIGGIEDLNPLNFTCVPSLNPIQQMVIQDKILVDQQMQESTTPIMKLKDRQKRKYTPLLPMVEPAVVCENCDGAFPTKYQYQRHQCEFNAAKVTLKQELPKRHIEKPKTKHECNICHKSFMTDHNLDRHQLSHGDTKPFTCQNCGKGFVLESRLNTHLENHCKMSTSENKRFYRTDLTVWQCWNCQLITASEPTHLVHICDNLNPTFVSTKKMLPPQNHPDENKENIDPSCYVLTPQDRKTNISPSTVTSGPKIFGEHSGNTEHLIFSNQNNFDTNFEKAIDGMDITLRREPGFYKDTIVPTKLPVMPADKIEHTFKKINIEHLFQCEFCNRTYAQRDVLKEHQNSHSTNKNYQCMFCEDSFESYTNALVHWQHKCDDKSNLFCLPKIIICKFCDKGFKSHELLYAHKYKLKHFVPKHFTKTDEPELCVEPEVQRPVANNIIITEDFKNISIFETNTINDEKPNINVMPFRNLQENGLFTNPSRSEISYEVSNGFGTVTITEFTKTSQREVLQNLNVSNDNETTFECNNAQIIRLDENMEIENFDTHEIKEDSESKLPIFTEDEIHGNISPLNTDTCSSELTQIDEFLNDIANKVLNKSETLCKLEKCPSPSNTSKDAEINEIKTEEDSSMRRKLRSSSKKTNEKDKKQDKPIFEVKKKNILKESFNRVCTRNMKKMKNKSVENFDEIENEEIKEKENRNKENSSPSNNESAEESPDKKKITKRKFIEKETNKPDTMIEEMKEAKPALVLSSKRGRKPKPKLPPSEMVVTCSDEFRFQCEKCSRLTRSIDELIEHRQIDHGSKFDCKDCGQVVHSSKALMIHCRAHQSLKPFVCDQCGRSYSQTSHLWQHMRFHQGIKPFACPHDGCEARYTIRPDLKDHIRKVHTRERPFKCAVCSKCFLTGSVYYQHRLIHNNDRRYGCDMCGKRFFRADALNNHRRIHTDERPFPCPVCGREFRQKGDRNKHHRTQHPTEIALNVANSAVMPTNT